MDDPQWLLDDYSLKPLDPPPHQAVEDDNNETQDYSLAVTGDVFRWMINYAPLETLQRVSPLVYKYTMVRLPSNCLSDAC